MTLALKLTGVEKRYGKTRALAGLNLEVPRGCLLGLIGPNGAGKTTTFGVVSGTIKPDAGSVDVLGGGAFDPAKNSGRLTVLPQDAELSPHVPPRVLLRYHAQLQGLSRKEALVEADRVLELVKLSDRARAPIRQLSHGMRRRVAVAQAFLGDPELVLLDEPTGGLDPHLMVDMRELLKRERGKRTLVVSTHILSDLEDTCDHVAFMEAGRCVRSDTLASVTGRANLVRVTTAEPVELNDALLELLKGRSPKVEGTLLTYTIEQSSDPARVQPEILGGLLAQKIPVLEVRFGESLEEAYMALRTED